MVEQASQVLGWNLCDNVGERLGTWPGTASAVTHVFLSSGWDSVFKPEDALGLYAEAC